MVADVALRRKHRAAAQDAEVWKLDQKKPTGDKEG